MFRRHVWAIAAAIAISTLALAGCAGTAGGGSSKTPGVTAAEDLTWAQQLSDQNLAGTDRDLPTSAPAPAAGKNVWVIECSATGAGCNLPAQGFAAAGAELGWSVTIVDGKQDPTVYNSGIRSAISADADAIVLAGPDCAVTQGALKEAIAAGIVVFGINALDCDDTYAGGGSKLFTASMPWGPEMQTYGAYLDNYVGPGIAAWVIAETAGSANVIMLTESDTGTTHHINDAQLKTFEERCGGCTVNQVDYTGADLFAGTLQAKVSAALQKYPDADVVMAPIDAAISLGTSAAVEQARATGREILLVGQEGNPGNVKLIQQGIQDFAIGRAMTWTGWAAADALNRVFAGEETVDEGIGFGSMDSDHKPSFDVYDGNPKSSGYQQNFLEIWGVS